MFRKCVWHRIVWLKHRSLTAQQFQANLLAGFEPLVAAELRPAWSTAKELRWKAASCRSFAARWATCRTRGCARLPCHWLHRFPSAAMAIGSDQQLRYQQVSAVGYDSLWFSYDQLCSCLISWQPPSPSLSPSIWPYLDRIDATIW